MREEQMPPREMYAVASDDQVALEYVAMTKSVAVLEARRLNRRCTLNRYRVYRVLVSDWQLVVEDVEQEES